MIIHYDLFAGIGGFSLALEEVFKDEEIKHIFCEWSEFPTAILRKHWPDGEFWGDIADLVAYSEGQGLEGRGSLKKPAGRGQSATDFTVVTGGFPCQPFSAAGRRRGTADDRYQWPNMFAVIKNVKPRWVIAENVRGLATWNDGMVLEQVCSDMEAIGYEVQPFIIPAVAVDAPHRRDRIWIIAHAKNQRSVTEMGLEREQKKKTAKHSRESRRPFSYPDWNQSWQEVALATCIAGMDDGLSVRMDDTIISGPRARNEAIKAYGNAIVPQVAMQIFRSMKLAMEGA